MSLTEADYSYLPIEQATDPTFAEGLTFQFMRDRYWAVHPERGLLFYKGKSPQCNSSEMISRKIAPPWARIVLLPVAFVPVRYRSDDWTYYVPKRNTVPA